MEGSIRERMIEREEWKAMDKQTHRQTNKER